MSQIPCPHGKPSKKDGKTPCQRRADKLRDAAQQVFKYVVQNGRMVKVRVTKKDE